MLEEALFPEPEHIPHELSRMYSPSLHRARSGRLPKWTKFAARQECAECFALQHENPHRLTRLRNRATARRSISGGRDLILCPSHAELWRERDADDLREKT